MFSPQSNAFRPAGDVRVSLPTDGFSKTATKDDYSIGLGAHAGWEYEDHDAGVNVGAQYTHSTSENTMYFADVNADHKPDIVKDGIVWFNNSHDDSITFGREFRPHMDPTKPCEISYFAIERSEGLDYSIFEGGHHTTTYVSWIDKNKNDQDTSTLVPTVLAPHTWDTLRRSVVRVWVALDSGEIQITGTAMLDSTFAVARERTNADGVHVSIQHNDSILWGTAHDLTKQAPQHDMSVSGVSVEQGDRIYFRVEALENDLYDVVNWEPVISYKNRNLSHTDNTGRPFYIFNAKNDFLAWKDERFSIPQNGEVRVSADGLYNGNFSHGETITLMIIKVDTAGDNPVTIKQATLNSSNTSLNNLFGGVRLDTIISLDTTEILYFKAESSMTVDWTKLRWFPHITSKSFDNGDSARFTILDGEGHTLTKNVIDVFVSPILPKEFLDFGTSDVPVDTAMFGNINHCWGNFIYNSNTMRTAIDESKIVKDSRYQRSQVDSIENNINSTYGQPVSADDVMPGLENLLPNPDQADASSLEAMYEPGKTSNRILVGFAGRNYVTPTQMGLYNWHSVQAALGDSALLLPVTNQSIAASGLTAVGPVKETYQHGFGVHASGGLSFSNDAGIGACVNYSNGENRLTADFVDFNGDGYPDVISETDAIYTNPWGGLSAKKAGINPLGEQGIYNSVYNAYSLQGGASYARYKKTGKARGTVHIQLRGEQARLSANGDGSVAKSDDHAELVWMDINGDGLPDCLDDKGHVAVNLGYDFYYHNDQYLTSYAPSGNGSICYNGSASLGVGGASDLIINNEILTTVNHSFVASASGSKSINSGKVMYVDMNGDGLVDKIADENKLYYNTGWGFVNTCQTLDNGAVSEDMSHCFGYSGNITLGVPVYLLGCFKLQGSAGLSSNNTAATTQTMLLDMNGDGLPDLVRQGGDGTSIEVKYNQLYDVDKLVSVQSFYGNQIAVGYAQADYSAEAQQRPTVMASLTVSDATTLSDDKRDYRYQYKNYVHSIEERTSYGFDSVIVTQYLDNTPYRITRQHYRTDLYKMRGKKASEMVADADGHRYVEKEWAYQLKLIENGNVVPVNMSHCYGATWPALDAVYTRHYNPLTNGIDIETEERYNHADSGRVEEYINFNNNATPDDDVHCHVTYSRRSRNQSAQPEDMTVTDADGNLLRMRSATYDSRGRLANLSCFTDEYNLATETEYTYDDYGNVLTAKLPPNGNDERAMFEYTYDTLVHMFRTRTVDVVFEDTSRAEYDVRLGLPLRIYSRGGDSISYAYDGWGRPLAVRAPQESDTTGHPTIHYLYWDDRSSRAPLICRPHFRSFTGTRVEPGLLTVPAEECHKGWPIWTQTLHRSQEDPGLDVTTAVFVDGHGRVLQTRKTAEVDGNIQQVASGTVVYDDAGRPIRSYEPFVTDEAYCDYVKKEPDEGVVTLSEYDVLDRVMRTEISPENIVTRYTYGFDAAGGIPCFRTETEDPEGRRSVTLADARGLTLSCIDAMLGITRFEYDALGQLSASYDPENYKTEYGYDKTGHLKYRIHPDAGRTDYDYDPAGNLTKETNPLGEISYDYTYYRLHHKRYTGMNAMDGNNVTYEYGTGGRAAGLPVRITDGGGVQSFEYDAMGNVSRSLRKMSIPSTGVTYAFVHTFSYDSWGRMLQMTYPDGERVYYSYNSAGELEGMTGEKNLHTRTYIQGIDYNKYGQRTFVLYGNDSRTEYTYDALQRLGNLSSRDGSNRAMQNIDYTFNQVNNIIQVQNNAGDIGGLGGTYTNYYEYDDLDRLVWASGTGVAEWQSRDFNVYGNYSASGRLGMKKQDWNSVTTHGAQTMEYGYPESGSGIRPHAPRLIDDQGMGNVYGLEWDDAGNLIQVAVQGDNPEYMARFLYWTEDNRLHTVADDWHYSYYAYDHTGQRTLKMAGDTYSSDQNAWSLYVGSTLDHVTMYPSPYMVLSEHGYTKHYYAGADRVAARIGGGNLNHDTVCVVVDDSIARRAEELFWSCNSRVNDFEITHRDLEEMNIENINGDWMDAMGMLDVNEVPSNLHAGLSPNAEKIKDAIEWLSAPNPRFRPGENDEPEVYYYHSDHLGGASWITDGTGKPVQHLQYLPFGEPFVDQHPAGYQERYTFTGKERDEETGYGYFGARYMDYTLMTSFISVDRYASKYLFISPYAYCAWNPIRLIDPTGDTVEIPNKEDRAFIHALIDKEIDGKKNSLYRKEFADKFDELQKSTHHYVFESWEYDASRDENGEFQAKSDYSTVKFTRGETPETKAPEIGASVYRVLYEETYHAWKFQENGCKPVTQTCLTEAEAWQFSTKAPGTKFYDEKRVQTIMGRVHNGSLKEVAKLLHDGFPNRPPYGTMMGAHGLKAKYPHLPLGYDD